MATSYKKLWHPLFLQGILHPQAAYTKRLISDVPKIHEEWDLSTVDLKSE